MPLTEEEKKQHMKDASKKWRAKNRERLRIKYKEWRKKNKEHVKQYREDNKQRTKQYQETNKDKLTIYYNKWKEANKERMKEYYKEYRENNKEKLKEGGKKYRENSKEKLKERAKKYYEKNKELVKKYTKECRKMCPNCKDWPDSRRANPKYNNYCTRCFQQLFPNDPLTSKIRKKTKEIAVRDFINENFGGFIHDKPLYTHNCNCAHRRRIDHRRQIDNTILAIETDEHQHRGYDKEDEDIRYNDVYMIFSGKWIFIRFNPDKYINKKGQRRNPKIDIRLKKLKKEIKTQINRIKNGENIDLLENIRLYYDKFD